MQVKFYDNEFSLEVDIDNETALTISEFTQIERMEFRKVIADGIEKTVKNIIDNPHFKGI